jgi:flagellar basal-body rod protein FlgB
MWMRFNGCPTYSALRWLLYFGRSPIHGGPFTGVSLVDAIRNDLTFSLLAKSLQGLSLRQELIAQNLANINTPGYSRRDVLFEDALRDALAEGKADGDTSAALDDVKFRVATEDALRYRVDNSSVDLDREMAEQAKAALKMSAVLSLMGKRIGMYKRALGEGA